MTGRDLKISDRLKQSIECDVSIDALLHIINMRTVPQWNDAVLSGEDLPIAVALKYDHWELITKLVIDGHHYISIFGNNFQMFTAIAERISNPTIKSRLMDALTKRCNSDFLNWVE